MPSILPAVLYLCVELLLMMCQESYSNVYHIGVARGCSGSRCPPGREIKNLAGLIWGVRCKYSPRGQECTPVGARSDIFSSGGKQGRLSPRGHGTFPPPTWPNGSPQFLIIMYLKCCASFDNHFETKVLFLMHFGSQIINEYYDDTNNGRMAD